MRCQSVVKVYYLHGTSIYENWKTMEIDLFSKYALKSSQTSHSDLAKQTTPIF